MTERKPADESWESFAERQIQESMAAGDFDDLPGFGKPIPDLSEPYDEYWWIRKKAHREQLSVLPPALQIRMDVEKTLKRLIEFKNESQVRREVEKLNERIRQANFAITWGPPSTTVPLDVEDVIKDWKVNT